jgi:hypothetical protein
LVVKPIIITDVSALVTAPVIGAAPSNSATPSDVSQYTVASVTWAPAHSNFRPNQVYTVSIKLDRINGNYEFEAPRPSAKINDEDAFVQNRAPGTVTITRTFAVTGERIDLSNNIIGEGANGIYNGLGHDGLKDTIRVNTPPNSPGVRAH